MRLFGQICVALGSLGTSFQLVAATQADTVTLDYIQPITILSANNLNFGEVTATSGNNQRFVVSPVDGAISGSGTDKHLGGQSRGEVALTAAPQEVQIYINAVSSVNAAVFRLGQVRCSINGGPSSLCTRNASLSFTPSDTSTQTIGLGMQLTMKTSTAPEASFQESFTFNAVYY